MPDNCSGVSDLTYFIKVTKTVDTPGRTLWIRNDQIAAVEGWKTSDAVITMANGNRIGVEESADEILDMLRYPFFD